MSVVAEGGGGIIGERKKGAWRGRNRMCMSLSAMFAIAAPTIYPEKSHSNWPRIPQEPLKDPVLEHHPLVRPR